jgi:hypothetical protein
MSHQSLTGNFLSARVRGALVALAALTISIPSVWADAQGDISVFLPAGKTILTAKAADLATAVTAAIETGTTGFTPAQLAAAAFQPVGGKVRSDRETSAAVVTDAVVTLFTSGTGHANANFASIIGATVDSVVAVNGTLNNTKLTLTTAGQSTVIKDALGTIADGLGTTGTGVLAADAKIGAALSGDPYLEGIAKAALTTALQVGIEGINGVKGKSTTNAPLAAQEFVSGILSTGTLPNDPATPAPAAYNTFAVAILKNVSKNASVDEFVSYQVGLSDTTGLVSLAQALATKYTTPATVAKIVQGVTADTTAAIGEAGRQTFINALTVALSKDAVAIAQGGAYVDPIYSGSFTAATFSGLVTDSTAKSNLATKYAAAIATGVGNILGQDGDELTQVALTYKKLLGANTLPPASAATYATDLITGAVKSKISTSAFTGAAAGLGGGTLAVGTGKFGSTVGNEVALDLSSVLNLFAEGIINGSSLATSKDVAAVAKEVGTLAEDVAKFVKNESSSAGGTSQPVAAYLAGTVANLVNALIGNTGATTTTKGVTLTAFQVIAAAISKDVQAVTQSTKNADVDTIVAAAVTNFASFPSAGTAGALGTVESPVTNL